MAQVAISEDIRKLVIARLETMPRDRGLAIGNLGSFTRDDLIKHVKSGDHIGDLMVEMQLEYLRALKEDDFFEFLTPDQA